MLCFFYILAKENTLHLICCIVHFIFIVGILSLVEQYKSVSMFGAQYNNCLLYTSDAADE